MSMDRCKPRYANPSFFTGLTDDEIKRLTPFCETQDEELQEAPVKTGEVL